MFVKKKDYQRTHLRAPYKEPILFKDKEFVFRASTLNLSEGGMLLDQVPYFPEDAERISVMIALPQLPYFKNFSLEKLQSFSSDMFPKKIIRLKCQMVRKIGIESKVDEVFMSRIGLRFLDVNPLDNKLIQDYVNIFSSNLIYLQVLIDSLHSDKKNLEKIRALCAILNYDPDMKLATLHKTVQHDYKSLQWL